MTHLPNLRAMAKVYDLLTGKRDDETELQYLARVRPPAWVCLIAANGEGVIRNESQGR